MRFGFAITALVLSGILLILGIGQRTFLAGPREIVHQAQLSAETGFAVIPASAFDAAPGQPNVLVEGPDAFVAIGKVRDVEAWVAPFEHDAISDEPGATSLAVERVRADAAAAKSYADSVTTEEGAEPPLPSPYLSDLWLERKGAPPEPAEAETAEETAEGEAAEGEATDQQEAPAEKPESREIRFPVDLPDDQAVLVAVAAGTASDSELSIVWVQDRRTPWAGPLLAAGGLLAVVGLVLYLLAVDHNRRGLGPRRGRKGPLLGIRDWISRGGRTHPSASTSTIGGDSGPKRGIAERSALRRASLPALGLAVALGLSGCSAGYWPDFSPQAEEQPSPKRESSVAPVPVTHAQIDRIIGDVVAISNAADDSLDATPLAARFAGDALNQRVANYKVRAAVSDYEFVVPRITGEQLGYELVQSTEGWPRTIFVTLASKSGKAPAETAEAETEEGAEQAAPAEESSPSLALILKQATPHQNFMVTRVFSLRGGITMPEAAPADEGTALLAPDLQTLALPPGEVGDNYSAVLLGTATEEQKALFDLGEDPLVGRVGAAWVAKAQESANSAGQTVTYSAEIKPSGAAVTSLSTGVGGALVAITLTEERIGDSGGTRYGPTAVGAVTALSGLSGRQDRLVQVVTNQLLFFVPSKTSNEPIQLLGFSSDLVGARNS